jgi:hypothetical protein
MLNSVHTFFFSSSPRFSPDRHQHPIVGYFWEVFHSLTVEQQKKLLFFVTGSDRVPILGLHGLKFIIQNGGSNTSMLPTAHT